MRPLLFPVIAALACLPQATFAEDAPLDAFPLRHHNPFLQVYGLPAFATHELAARGGIDVSVALDIANDADRANRDGEILLIDAEIRTLNVALRHRIGERFEIGLDVPYVSYSGGFLDNVIYEFHQIFGFSNASREGPRDQFRLYMEKDGVTLYEASETSSGIGDVQFSAAMRLGSTTLRASVKAPTGDADKLTGSGAADLALGIYGGGTTTLLERSLSYSGFAGVLALGDGDVLPTLQKNVVPYGGLALRWQASARFALATQLYAQAPYLDASLDDLGGPTFQLAFGGDYRFPAQNLLLRFAIAEDVDLAASPDFAMHLSLRRYID